MSLCFDCHFPHWTPIKQLSQKHGYSTSWKPGIEMTHLSLDFSYKSIFPWHLSDQCPPRIFDGEVTLNAAQMDTMIARIAIELPARPWSSWVSQHGLMLWNHVKNHLGKHSGEQTSVPDFLNSFWFYQVSLSVFWSNLNRCNGHPMRRRASRPKMKRRW